MLPYYCDATKANSRTIRSRVQQPAFGAKDQIKWAAVSWLHNARTVDWLLCSVNIISANKLSLQELGQLIGINLLILRLLEFFS